MYQDVVIHTRGRAPRHRRLEARRARSCRAATADVVIACQAGQGSRATGVNTELGIKVGACIAGRQRDLIAIAGHDIPDTAAGAVTVVPQAMGAAFATKSFAGEAVTTTVVVAVTLQTV